jgi:cytidine deaminase
LSLGGEFRILATAWFCDYETLKNSEFWVIAERRWRLDMDFDGLYELAKGVLSPRRLTEEAEAGGVGAAILADDREIYTGVCIDTSSGMGFCAEHAAAAAMITAGESRVLKMVAVGWDGQIMPPCGRCREFISQLHEENRDAKVLVADGVVVTVRELLPFDWRE